ncbi:MAG: thioredoxin domain-containing protein [Caulobacteraceae bacterium]|nr:thioredoxin domain-containing protein [Caulobacteraceae bacterium]
MRPTRLTLHLLAAALALTACQKTADKAFGEQVRAYLLAHPEVIQEAENKLQVQQQQQQLDQAKSLIARNRFAIERDPSDYVANPGGKVTVTEFYDYRCPHCANMAPTVLSLIHDNPDVRFVFKEFPIFGDVSDAAAEGALLLKQQGGDCLGLYHDFMAQKAMDEPAMEQILKAHGVDPAKLADPAVQAATRAHLNAVKQLAVALDIQGTPTFIVGDTEIPGEDPEGLKAAIAAARAKG